MRWTVRALGLVFVAAVAAVLVRTYRAHQARIAAQAVRAEPVVAPSRVQDVGGEAMIVLDSADVARLGLRTAVLRATASAPVRHLAGELVAEPDRITTVRAPVAGRLALPEGVRWPAFGERLAGGAPIAQVSDAKPLVLPRGGIVTQVGAQPGEMVQPGQVLLEVTDYDEPLVRVAWPADVPGPPAEVGVSPGAEGGRGVRARLLGAAPAADPVTRLPAYLFRAERGWRGARPGAAVVVAVPDRGAPGRGVLVPDHAVVQWEGLTWVFVERGAGRFGRVRVPTDRPVAGGYLASAGLLAGDTVVVEGAEQLLSEEFRARVTVGDEPGE
ncbi:MAG: HlyD family efflux transporter periplasmic adaptor subunit [Deltaproteobacteria bacterium]